MEQLEEIRELERRLASAAAYRNVTLLPAVKAALGLLEELGAVSPRPRVLLDRWAELFYALAGEGYASLGEYLRDHILYDDSPYARAASEGKADPSLVRAARRDLDAFSRLGSLGAKRLKALALEAAGPEYGPAVDALPEWRTGRKLDFQKITEQYRRNGWGPFARYRAFVWEDPHLIPVEDPDVPGADELVGYRLQRTAVIDNTRAFLKGNRINNVLLYGESGTGKSATVKSLLGIPEFGDLRIVEVRRERLGDLPELIRQLSGRRQKFILFLDDLTFENDDKTFSCLKTVLEGGLERRPVNVAVYATSNRRHLVREFFSERGKDEIDPKESIQEKAALSERFGIRIPFLALGKQEYLELVDILAARAGIRMEPEALHGEAMRWELHHAGRTPRTARQFIDYLLGRGCVCPPDEGDFERPL
ncbi:ATP-binding protein [Papillibacter cinnamivorans]|uniref:AAA+ ATPase domain-containing protein n=1 Tax=Papillibacter cinnamivorans DSM 12816 TaxID=1122930 RepID=A0A1W2A0Z4_9FIRM|nr:ATP-binding protein [Papillibacter cinnamivorans]SMC53978.1 hypothetical protein SAMN02745168_1359 [Papillibacter cinnamivorans DSM 12816]